MARVPTMPKPAQYAESGTVDNAGNGTVKTKASLARLRRFATVGHFATVIGGDEGRDGELAPALSSRRLRSLARAAQLLAELRPVIQRQRNAESRRRRTKRELAAKRALPWAKQQKPAKSTPPRAWVEKPWCQACDRYHVEGKHGPGRAK